MILYIVAQNNGSWDGWASIHSVWTDKVKAEEEVARYNRWRGKYNDNKFLVIEVEANTPATTRYYYYDGSNSYLQEVDALND